MRRFSRLVETQKTKAAAALAFTCLLAIVSAGGVFGAFSASVSSTGNQFTTASDLTPPTTSRAVLRKSYGGVSGFTGCGIGGCSVLESRQFYVYAQVTDGGSPPSGVNTVNATVGGSNAAMTTSGGPWTVDGQTFNYRSGFLTRSAAQLAVGARTYTIAATDNAGRSSTSSAYNFNVDATQPNPTSATLANGSGSAGQPDSGDTITVDYDSSLDPSSMFGTWTTSGPPPAYTNAWDGTSAPVKVNLTSPSVYGGSAGDPIRITVQHSVLSGNPQLNIGNVRVYSDDWYVKCQAQFNATAQLANTNQRVVITLGTEITSGQLQIPAPVTPQIETCS